MRYRYVAYKYTKRKSPDASFQSIWDVVGSYPMQSSIVWRPPTDIYETEDRIVVVVELAGAVEEDLSVTLFSDLLVVEGRRDAPISDMSACHQLGIKYGPFKAEIGLHAAVDHDAVRAEFKNGLLIITLPKLD